MELDNCSYDSFSLVSLVMCTIFFLSACVNAGIIALARFNALIVFFSTWKSDHLNHNQFSTVYNSKLMVDFWCLWVA